MKIREDQEIRGLKIRKEEYKTQAFADDMVFILEEPLEKGSKLIQKIEEFDEVARLKINKDKSKLITKNIAKGQEKELEDKIKMKITKKIKYLGIWLTAKCSSIKEDNYDKLIFEIKKDMEIGENYKFQF